MAVSVICIKPYTPRASAVCSKRLTRSSCQGTNRGGPKRDDLDRTITSWNRAAAIVLGYAVRDSILARPCGVSQRSHEDIARCVARTLIRSESRPLSSLITRVCEESAMYAS